MWIKSKNLLPIIVSLCLLAFCCLYSSAGYTQTVTETTQSITIPMQQWNGLKKELMLLNQDLTACKSDMMRLKKPSSQLVEELQQAQDSLLKLTKTLDEQKSDLIQLSKEASELKSSLAILRSQIEKERRVHRRQVWQNRIWCIILGAAAGFAAAK